MESGMHVLTELQALFSVNLLHEVVESSSSSESNNNNNNNSLSLTVFFSAGNHATSWMSEVFVILFCILLLKRFIRFELLSFKQISIAQSRRNFKSKTIFLQNLKSRMVQKEYPWSRDGSESSLGSDESDVLDRFQTSCSETELTDDRLNLLVEDETDIESDFEDDFLESRSEENVDELEGDESDDTDSCPSWYNEFYPKR
jgi:tRNA splicing endonuclease